VPRNKFSTDNIDIYYIYQGFRSSGSALNLSLNDTLQLAEHGCWDAVCVYILR